MELKSLKHTSNFLSIFGLTKTKLSPKWSILHSLVMNVLQNILINFMVFAQIYLVHQLAVNGTNLEFITSLAILFSLIFVSYKVMFFRLRRSQIFCIASDIEKLMKCSQSNVQAIQWDKRVVRDFYIYLSSIYFAIISTVFVAIISFKDKKLGYNIWVPFDYSESDLQLICSSVFATLLAIHNMTLAYTIDFYVISLLGVMKGCILDFIKEIDDGTQNLQSVIENLSNVQQLMRKVNEEIAYMFLPQVVLMSIILCFGSYGLTLVN